MIWFAPINVLATVAICVTLLVLTPNKANAAWVFTTFTDGSGWGTGFSFLLSFLSVAWVMTDYDGTTHMAEETHNAAIRGPMAIRWAVTISGTLSHNRNGNCTQHIFYREPRLDPNCNFLLLHQRLR